MGQESLSQTREARSGEARPPPGPRAKPGGEGGVEKAAERGPRETHSEKPEATGGKILHNST